MIKRCMLQQWKGLTSKQRRMASDAWNYSNPKLYWMAPSTMMNIETPILKGEFKNDNIITNEYLISVKEELDDALIIHYINHA